MKKLSLLIKYMIAAVIGVMMFKYVYVHIRCGTGSPGGEILFLFMPAWVAVFGEIGKDILHMFKKEQKKNAE